MAWSSLLQPQDLSSRPLYLMVLFITASEDPSPRPLHLMVLFITASGPITTSSLSHGPLYFVRLRTPHHVLSISWSSLLCGSQDPSPRPHYLMVLFITASEDPSPRPLYCRLLAKLTIPPFQFRVKVGNIYWAEPYDRIYLLLGTCFRTLYTIKFEGISYTNLNTFQ
jgi:hypothetical protein